MPLIDIAGHHQGRATAHIPRTDVAQCAPRPHTHPPTHPNRGGILSPPNTGTHCRGNPALVGASIGTPVAGVLAVATGTVAVVVVAAVAGVSLLLVRGCEGGGGEGQRVHAGLPTDGRWP